MSGRCDHRHAGGVEQESWGEEKHGSLTEPRNYYYAFFPSSFGPLGIFYTLGVFGAIVILFPPTWGPEDPPLLDPRVRLSPESVLYQPRVYLCDLGYVTHNNIWC